MKSLLVSALSLLALPLLAQTSTSTTTASSTSTSAAGSAPAPAAAPDRPSPTSMMQQVESVLTPDERTQLMSARTKAMADNPALQTEEMDLMQKGMAMQGGGEVTDADKQAFRTEAQAHANKVRAAMIKADPTVEPLIKKIEAQIAKLRAQYGQ